MRLLDDNQEDRHNLFMREALREAEKAAEKGEVPVGCVIVHDNRIIGRGYNRREALQDATAHAEIIAISAACQTMHSWRLEDCTMYVTLEPCPMCAGAIVLTRIPVLVYGADDPKAGACGTLLDIVRDSRLNHIVDVIDGVMAREAQSLLQDFFRTLRRRNSKAED
ncbi:MAG: tRNA adenosine(34) deaminase TadA [candidate division Zixibacteria bacterium]|nr:tRNA adenosine(34) deaminase TadA [candidate division Zixibacteria bacterium]MBU1470720.1 tRNA adenosine(34) deaminase TadA [candidate division Zixibacteria bacterium]MBU2624520.1 tRNA adenosine(34) deaminase TadA [candidate division Zixibacteria bacterium]